MRKKELNRFFPIECFDVLTGISKRVDDATRDIELETHRAGHGSDGLLATGIVRFDVDVVSQAYEGKSGLGGVKIGAYAGRIGAPKIFALFVGALPGLQ